MFDFINKAIDWVNKLLSDVDGDPSSKRIVTIASLIFLMVYSTLHQVMGYVLDNSILETFKDITMIGIGFVGAEKFTKRPFGDDTSDDSKDSDQK